MDLRLLNTFRMVAQLRSFSRAAAALDYAQSTVTLHIQSLEADVATPLFNRTGKQITLTEAGERLLSHADRLLGMAEEVRAAVRGEQTVSGTLIIGAPETVCTYRLPPVLRQFRQSLPQVRLVFRPLPYEDLFRSVKEGSVDIGYMLEKRIDSASLCVETLTREPLVIVAAPENPLAQRKTVALSDLREESFLMTENGCGYRHLFEHALHEAGVFPGAQIEFDSVEAIKQCVIANVGIAVLPEVTVCKEIAAGELCPLNWTTSGFEIYTQMLWHRDKWLSPSMQAFIDLSREILLAGEPG